MIGALERVGRFTSGRIRLKRVEGTSKKDFHPFIEENTAPDCRLHTDAAGGYVDVPRKHFPVNLSATTSDVPLEFMRIHRVFTNFKRWGLGTFHGFRPKHIDAYLNEYVFRWNRRRSFQSGMDRMLGIGLSLKPITYRDIVGDTTEWQEQQPRSWRNCGSDLRGRPGSAPRTRAARQQDLSWRRGALKMSPCRKAIGIHHASRPRNSGSDTCATSRQKRESGPERDLYVSPLFSLTIPCRDQDSGIPLC